MNELRLKLNFLPVCVGIFERLHLLVKSQLPFSLTRLEGCFKTRDDGCAYLLPLCIQFISETIMLNRQVPRRFWACVTGFHRQNEKVFRRLLLSWELGGESCSRQASATSQTLREPSFFLYWTTITFKKRQTGRVVALTAPRT